MSLLRSVSFLALASLALAAQADTTIGTGTAPVSGTTNQWDFTAQTFVVPTDNVLKEYTFGFGSTSGTVGFSLYAWSGTDVVGPALYSQNVAVTGTGDYTVGGLDLALATGATYAAVFDLRGFDFVTARTVAFVSNAYAGGQGYWRREAEGYVSYPQFDHSFSATFGPSAAPSVPGPLAALPFALMALKRRKKA